MTQNPFNQPQIEDLETKDDVLVHIACESGRYSPPGKAVSICGYYVPTGEEWSTDEASEAPPCPRCQKIDDDNEACRSCKQAQLCGWAKRVGIDDADCHYNAASDVLEVVYTFGRPTEQKESSK